MVPESHDDPAAERTGGRTFSRRGCLRGLLATGSALGALGLSSPASGQGTRSADGEVGLELGSNPSASVQDGGLTVTDLTSPDLAPIGLAQRLVAQGGGVDLSAESVSFDGDERAAGTFSGGGGILGFTEGIVLSTGQVSDVVGPNDASSTTTSLGTDGDAALDELAEGTTSDAAILEFEFTVPEGVEQVTFDYIFGSEEYNEFVGSQFNDVFAFYVNGDNCAVVEDPDTPDGTSPVSINTINIGQPGVDPTNPSQYVNNDPFNPDADGEVVPEDELEDTEMDGFTTVLTCTASVNPGETNTMRLAIADAGDSAYDSWVLLQAGSLTIPEDNLAPVRIAHLVPDAPAVDVYVDGSQVLSGLGFRDVTQYLSIPVGTRTVRITPAGEPDTTVFEGDATVEAGRTTLAAVGELSEESIGVEMLNDESGLSDPSKALVRVVHASPDAPPVTVSANGSALAEDLAFGEATDYAEVSPGEYEIAVAPASDPGQSVATFDLSVDGCSVYTVFAAGYLTPDDEPADEPFGVVTALDDSGLETDYATQLSGANEVPPVDTDAAGSAVFDLRGDGQALRYEVAATGLENTLQGHIHAGGPDENGPVVAFLYEFAPLDASAEEARTLEGTLGNANITADDLVGPLEGESLDALIDLIESGEAYVNLHTVANPSGEIRGQIHSGGT